MHCISYVVALQQQRGGCPANINHIGCCTRELLHTFHNLQFCIHPVVSFVSLFFWGGFYCSLFPFGFTPRSRHSFGFFGLDHIPDQDSDHHTTTE
ncbi:unnamed protein product [Penicillium nalgiovense]|nr:unnamed protein product [Penicillium nalgiovense]